MAAIKELHDQGKKLSMHMDIDRNRSDRNYMQRYMEHSNSHK